MSLTSDLASAFAEREATHPVICGNASTRAFFDRAGAVRKVSGGSVQVDVDTLYIVRGALDPFARQEAQIRVGALGAASADGGTLYRISRSPQLLDDGEMQEIQLAGGAS